MSVNGGDIGDDATPHTSDAISSETYNANADR